MASAASERERDEGLHGHGRHAGAVVLIGDGDANARASISKALRRAGFATVEAGGGEEALELARADGPAAVVLEVALSGLSGYSVCRMLREELGDELPIVLVSAERTDPVDRVAGLLVGADDYLAKPVTPEELVLRITRLVRRAGAGAAAIGALTRREHEVLGLLARGLAHKEIAAELFLSPKTVGTHVEKIFRKLAVSSRADAVAAAIRKGLLEPEG